jgi:hypothetical protein
MDAKAFFLERQNDTDGARKLYDRAFATALSATSLDADSIAKSAAIEAKYEFLERQKSGTKAPLIPMQKAGVGEAFDIAIDDD